MLRVPHIALMWESQWWYCYIAMPWLKLTVEPFVQTSPPRDLSMHFLWGNRKEVLYIDDYKLQFVYRTNEEWPHFVPSAFLQHQSLCRSPSAVPTPQEQPMVEGLSCTHITVWTQVGPWYPCTHNIIWAHGSGSFLLSGPMVGQFFWNHIIVWTQMGPRDPLINRYW